MTTPNDIYVQKGFRNRTEYLRSLAENYCVDEHIVFEVADLLGEEEDFDGLIIGLDDYSLDH